MAAYGADRILIQTEEIPGSTHFRLRVLIRRVDNGEWANVLRQSFDGIAVMRPNDCLVLKLGNLSVATPLGFEPRPDLDALCKEP